MERVSAVQRVGALVAACFLSGCFVVGHDRYLTARPLAPRRVQGALGVQAVGVLGSRVPRQAVGFSPVAPDFHVRVGLFREVDAGVRVGAVPPAIGSPRTAVALGVDVKGRLFDGSVLDLAVAPQLTYSVTSAPTTGADGYVHRRGFDTWVLDAPVALGFDLVEWAAVVLSPGVLYGGDPRSRPLNHVLDATVTRGPALRCGLGVELRNGDRAAVHPEVTVVVPLRELERRIVYTVGVGFRFGNAPPAAKR